MPVPFDPASVRFPSVPDPPRFDLWPEAVRSAARMRGALVACGPGWRGVGWPETPRVRLTALAHCLTGDCIASHLTAAWVWGAARAPDTPLEVATMPGHRRPVVPAETRRLYELRLDLDRDTVRFGRFRTTTPLRTIVDLLFRVDDDSPRLATDATVACRLLCRLVEGGAPAVHAWLREHRRPHRQLAITRFTALAPPPA